MRIGLPPVYAIIGLTLSKLDMHRGFFARAVSDHPKDPLGSPYGSSFIAAYRSAGSLVALVRNIHSQLKELSERMWFLWTHLFSCSVSATLPRNAAQNETHRICRLYWDRS